MTFDELKVNEVYFFSYQNDNDNSSGIEYFVAEIVKRDKTSIHLADKYSNFGNYNDNWHIYTTASYMSYYKIIDKLPSSDDYELYIHQNYPELFI